MSDHSAVSLQGGKPGTTLPRVRAQPDLSLASKSPAPLICKIDGPTLTKQSSARPPDWRPLLEAWSGPLGQVGKMGVGTAAEKVNVCKSHSPSNQPAPTPTPLKISPTSPPRLVLLHEEGALNGPCCFSIRCQPVRCAIAGAPGIIWPPPSGTLLLFCLRRRELVACPQLIRRDGLG